MLPFWILFSLTLGVCSGAVSVEPLPPIPYVERPVEIQVAYPTPWMPAPDVDSTFIFGTVGTGSAKLSINGSPVQVAPNGAFLAFLPMPEDRRFRLVAIKDGRRYGHTFSYLPPERETKTRDIRTVFEPFDPARSAVVTGGQDTLATGSEIKFASPEPGADRRWFFPKGSRLEVTGRRGDLLSVRLTDKTTAWMDTSLVTFVDDDIRPEGGGHVSLHSSGRSTDVTIPAGYAPFLIDPRSNEVLVTVYGRDIGLEEVEAKDMEMVSSVAWTSSTPDSSVLRIVLREALWGYKAFYEPDGNLVVRLRRAPELDPGMPFKGVKILIDPGHPPGGAIGPTGLREPEANLAISLDLARMLRERGAEVVLTRTTPEPMVSETDDAQELWRRVAYAVEEDVDLLVSVHNNAFPEGTNPFLNYGTEVYYYHPFSESLARVLACEIVGVTGLPHLGAKRRSLALVRPTWMPSVLTESVFLMFPEQEEALRDRAFVARLAAAHARGIEAFLRQWIRV